VTLTATWLLPIAIIPGTWQVYEIPPTPQITQGEIPSQPELNETKEAVSAETEEGEGPVEEVAPNKTENDPEQMGSTSQEPDQDQTWGSSPYSSTQQQQQGYWDLSPSVVWVPPEHGYPDPMYSSSSSFHYSSQLHYPPGAYFTPLPGYPTPIYGYYHPMNPEQTPETYESTAYEPIAPPPVVLHTVPLPSSRPNTPPRWRR
jgi:hypothetical protein